MPRIQIEADVALYYEDFGTGPPIVFVHGGAATHDLWEQQVHHLSGSFRTVVYDHRGVGASDKPRSGYTVQRLADDLHALVGGLGLSDAILVGHGLGGHVVLRCVAEHPEVAGRIVLCSAAPWYVGDKDGAGGFSAEFADDLASGMARNAAQANWDLIERHLFHADPGLATKIAILQMALAWPLHVLRELMEDLPTVDHRQTLGSIAQPALVLHGRHDRKNRYEGAEALVEGLPNARLVTFEHSAHSPFLEEVEGFNEALAAFAGSPAS
jgi:pimeloyl-ACP methyl ester carboxylesterase